MSMTTRTARSCWPTRKPSRRPGSVEEAELVHQPLGVQRPALAVGADHAERRLVAGQVGAHQDPLGELQVVAGDALVVPGRDRVPRREAGAALGREPGAARAAEVLGRRRVVRRRPAPPGGAMRDSTLCSSGARSKCRPSRARDRLGHQALQPLAQHLLALDRRAVLVEVAHRLERAWRRAGSRSASARISASRRWNSSQP